MLRFAPEPEYSDKKAEGLKTLDLVVKKVEKRDKLIKIADKSEFGWETVNEYMSDDVASDNEDRKRIKRAEERAEQKKKRIESKITQESKRRKLSGDQSSSFRGSYDQFLN